MEPVSITALIIAIVATTGIAIERVVRAFRRVRVGYRDRSRSRGRDRARRTRSEEILDILRRRKSN